MARTRELVPGLLLLAITAVLLAPALHGPAAPQDEGILLAYPGDILRGAWPQRDFASLYGPGTFWLLAIVFKLFGASVGAERAVGMALRLGIVWGVVRLARPWGQVMSVVSGAVAAALLVVHGSTGALTASAWLTGYTALLFSIVLLAAHQAAPERRRCLAGAGATAVLAILMRYENAVPVALITTVFLVRTNAWRAWLKGAAAPGALLVVHLIVVGPMHVGRTVRDMLVIPAGRHLPLPAVASAQGHILWGVVAAVVITIVVGAVQMRRAPERGRTVLALGLLGLATLPYEFQRATLQNMLLVSIAPAVGLVLSSAPLASRLRRPRGVAEALAVAIALGCVFVVTRDPTLNADVHAQLRRALGRTPDLASRDVRVGNRAFPLGPATAADAARIVDRLASLARPGDSLWVGQPDLRLAMLADSYLYYLFPRMTPASYYQELNPGTANRRGAGLAAAIRRADFVVLDSAWDRAVERSNDSDKPGDPALAGALDQHDLVLRAGLYSLWKRR